MVLLTLWLAWATAEPARIFYSKSFPGSNPPYVAIRVDESGRGEYREQDDEDPLRFQMSPAETREIFALAAKLDHFRRPLEARAKVAFTGTKTFRYERGPIHYEVKFNFSTDPDARALWDWFERITESAQLLQRLQRAARYDRLGVNQALLELEMAWDRKRLVAPQQFVPLLERIAGNQVYMHIARERAARLLELFRAGTTSAP
ncbi:MAG: hypothetical protein RMI94_01665 [Bryobacterales bacterium]|nr:hypothetical protein [Bryobacteraceae bacterium]MDW8129227.1 hypothetical protein [Bryobacterales bacterium]